MNTQLTVAIHVVGLLDWYERETDKLATSEKLAASVNTNAVVVRRVLQKLKEAGLVDTKRGPGGGSKLARKAEQITLCDVYEAVRCEEELIPGHARGPNPECALGCQMANYLGDVYRKAENALKTELANTTVAQMRDSVSELVRGCDAAPRREAS